MAQEGAIAQITHSFILKYITCQVFFKCNIYVKARDRKIDISIECPLYILDYKICGYVTAPL